MAKRKKPAATYLQPNGPDLVVTFTLVVKRSTGTAAGCSMSLGVEGDEFLVEQVGRASETLLRPAADTLKTAIMAAIGAVSNGPPTDALAMTSKIGRA